MVVENLREGASGTMFYLQLKCEKQEEGHALEAKDSSLNNSFNFLKGFMKNFN